MWRMVWREKASFGSSLTALICPYSPEPFLHRLRLFHPWTQRGREKALCRNRFVAASDTLFFVVVRFSRGQVGWVQIHAAKWIMQSKAKRNFSFFFLCRLVSMQTAINSFIGPDEVRLWSTGPSRRRFSCVGRFFDFLNPLISQRASSIRFFPLHPL